MNKNKVFINATGKRFRLSPKDKIYWRISGYVVILTSKKKLLVVKPVWSNLWELPGGGIDTKESISSGIKREILEETGFKINIDFSTPFYIGEDYFYYQRGTKKYNHSIHLVYKAKIVGKRNKEMIDKSEIQEVQFIELKDLNKRNCHRIALPAIYLLKNG